MYENFVRKVRTKTSYENFVRKFRTKSSYEKFVRKLRTLKNFHVKNLCTKFSYEISYEVFARSSHVRKFRTKFRTSISKSDIIGQDKGQSHWFSPGDTYDWTIGPIPDAAEAAGTVRRNVKKC